MPKRSIFSPLAKITFAPSPRLHPQSIPSLTTSSTHTQNKYSETSSNGPSEKRTTSVQLIDHLPFIDFTIEQYISNLRTIYNAQSLNPEMVAHNLMKAVDMKILVGVVSLSVSRGNFVLAKVCLGLSVSVVRR